MNNLTLLETILTIYIIVVNVLGVIMIIMPKKVSNIIFYIWIGVTIPITLPMILYELTFDKTYCENELKGIGPVYIKGVDRK